MYGATNKLACGVCRDSKAASKQASGMYDIRLSSFLRFTVSTDRGKDSMMENEDVFQRCYLTY